MIFIEISSLENDYPHLIVESHSSSESALEVFLWLICGFASGNLLFEIIDFVLLWIRGRSGLNLIIGKLVLFIELTFFCFS